jgi:hypothetical protein
MYPRRVEQYYQVDIYREDYDTGEREFVDTVPIQVTVTLRDHNGVSVPTIKLEASGIEQYPCSYEFVEREAGTLIVHYDPPQPSKPERTPRCMDCSRLILDGKS